MKRLSAMPPAGYHCGGMRSVSAAALIVTIDATLYAAGELDPTVGAGDKVIADFHDCDDHAEALVLPPGRQARRRKQRIRR